MFTGVGVAARFCGVVVCACASVTVEPRPSGLELAPLPLLRFKTSSLHCMPILLCDIRQMIVGAGKGAECKETLHSRDRAKRFTWANDAKRSLP